MVWALARAFSAVLPRALATPALRNLLPHNDLRHKLWPAIRQDLFLDCTLTGSATRGNLHTQWAKRANARRGRDASLNPLWRRGNQIITRRLMCCGRCPGPDHVGNETKRLCRIQSTVHPCPDRIPIGSSQRPIAVLNHRVTEVSLVQAVHVFARFYSIHVGLPFPRSLSEVRQ